MRSNEKRQWLTLNKILCFAMLLLVAGYIYARPTLERWFDVELPALVNNEADDQPGDQSKSDTETEASALELVEIRADTYRTPAGLIYAPGHGGREHRIQHVMLHARDDPSGTIHGVFDADQRDQVLKLIDEAYQLVLTNSNRVISKRSGSRTALTIDMRRRIGYVGGRQGQSDGNPECRKLRLVLEQDRVITAYPIR